MLQESLAVVLVLSLLAAALLLLRKKGFAQFNGPMPRSGNRERQMRVIERVPLSPQHSLHLVQVRNDVLLIGTSPSGCNALKTYSGNRGTVTGDTD